MSANKDRGTRWETAIVEYLHECGWPYAERRALNGLRDRGDIAGLPGVVIEAKSTKEYRLGEWVGEAERERINAGAEVGAVWAHRRGKSSPAEGYVIMTGSEFVNLLKVAGW